MKITYESILETYELPIRFYCVKHLDYSLDYQNCHENVELLYCFDGSGEVFYNNEYLPIKKGDFCCINSMCVHDIKGKEGSGFSFYDIIFDIDYCKYNNLNIHEYLLEKTFSDKDAEKKLFDLVECFYSEKSTFYKADLYKSLLDFLIHISKYHTISYFATSQENDNILYAIGYIKSNFNKKLSIDEISTQSGLSRYHFSRKFKKKTGYTVTDYVNKLRCENACNLLKIKENTVLDVFNQSCFDNLSYFSKMFKKHTGFSPSEYKKKFE